MMLKQTKHAGFTLVECLVVISILAIMTAMAVPSFQQLNDHAQQLQVIYQLQAAVLMARHLSIIEKTTVLICPARAEMRMDASQRPACDANYSEGVALWSQQAMGWRLRRVWQWSSTALTNRRGNRKVSLERGPKVAIIRLLTIRMPATTICTGISSATSADPVEESVKAKRTEPMTSR